MKRHFGWRETCVDSFLPTASSPLRFRTAIWSHSHSLLLLLPDVDSASDSSPDFLKLQLVLLVRRFVSRPLSWMISTDHSSLSSRRNPTFRPPPSISLPFVNSRNRQQNPLQVMTTPTRVKTIPSSSLPPKNDRNHLVPTSLRDSLFCQTASNHQFSTGRLDRRSDGTMKKWRR